MVMTVERLRALFEAAPVLAAVYDSFDRLRYANRAFREAFFVEADDEPFWPDLMRRNHCAGRGTVIRNPDFDEWLVSTLSRRGKVPVRCFETDLWDGRWLWMTETVGDDGWMLCIASDITSLRADDRTVRQDRDFAIKAAFTDDLTGVSNRRYLVERIRELISAAVQTPMTGCVAVLDLDNFKYINDRYGHGVGDEVLRDFARRIQEQTRRADCFGRIGGEEFILVLPMTPPEQAELVVERMLTVVRRSRPLNGRPDFSYSFSAGIAVAEPGDSVETLCQRADRALYAAKLAGRNRAAFDQGLRGVSDG